MEGCLPAPYMPWCGEATSSAFHVGIVSYLSGASQAYRLLGKPCKEFQNDTGRFPRTGEHQGDYNHLPPLLSSLFVRSLAEQLAIMRF